MKRLLLLAALAAAPPLGAAETLTVQTGQWYRIFAPEVEQALGKRVQVDIASIVPGGLGRQFRQVTVLLWDQSGLPAGTTVYAQRSVECTRGLQLTSRWSAIGPQGTLLASRTATRATVVNWDSQDGRVIRFVCQGVPSR